MGRCKGINSRNRVNQQIRAREVRLISADGEQLGVVPLAKALQMAEEATLDLVEVAPNSDPPVCKIMDHGRLVYEMKRRAREQKKKVRSQEIKEIKMRPNTDKHDLETKVNHARDFLGKGHKVKLTVMYRGREMTHFDRGTDVLNRAAAALADIADIEALPASRGRFQTMVLAPRKAASKPKPSAAAAPEPQPSANA